MNLQLQQLLFVSVINKKSQVSQDNIQVWHFRTAIWEQLWLLPLVMEQPAVAVVHIYILHNCANMQELCCKPLLSSSYFVVKSEHLVVTMP